MYGRCRWFIIPWELGEISSTQVSKTVVQYFREQAERDRLPFVSHQLIYTIQASTFEHQGCLYKSLNADSKMSSLPATESLAPTMQLCVSNKLRVSLIWACCLALMGLGAPVSVEFSSSLAVFVDRLEDASVPVLPRQYHSTWDFSSNKVHHWLTSFLFKDGKNFNPKLFYLGRDPLKLDIHLAVAHWYPNTFLLNRVRPIGAQTVNLEYRHRLLAMKLASHEEPEFVGILWIKDKRNAKKARAADRAKRSGKHREERRESQGRSKSDPPWDYLIEVRCSLDPLSITSLSTILVYIHRITCLLR